MSAIARRALPWLLAAAVAACFPVLALEPARSDVVIAVTPTRIPLELMPEEARNAEVTLINQGTEEAKLRPRIMLVEEEAEGGLSIGQDQRCTWLTYEDEELTLMPAEQKGFSFTTSVPAGTAPGLHHFALTFELARDDGEGIGLTGGVAVLVDLEVLAVEGVGNSGFPLALAVSLTALAGLAVISLVAVKGFKRRKRPAGQETTNAGSTGGDGR